MAESPLPKDNSADKKDSISFSCSRSPRKQLSGQSHEA